MELGAFAEWLRKNHYRESTIKQTLSDLQRASSVDVGDENVKNALRRYATFATQFEIQDAFTEAATRVGVGNVKRLPDAVDTSRKLEARSFDDADWDRLVAAVKDSPRPTDQVIWAMVTTGLRIGDALRVERAELVALLDAATPMIQVEVKGGRFRAVPLGIVEPWRAIARGTLETKAKNVAQYVCPGATGDVRGSCAYYRIDRRLKTLKRTLGLEGRANAHRIRRTIAVKTLESTDNIVQAQQMLGHRTQQSTLKYVDEVNFRKTRQLQRKLAGLE